MPQAIRDRVTGFVLLTVAIIWTVGVYWEIPGISESAARIGPRAFPLVMGWLLALLAVLMLVSGFLTTPGEAGSSARSGLASRGAARRALGGRGHVRLRTGLCVRARMVRLHHRHRRAGGGLSLVHAAQPVARAVDRAAARSRGRRLVRHESTDGRLSAARQFDLGVLMLALVGTTNVRAAYPCSSPPPCGEGSGVGVVFGGDAMTSSSTPLPSPPPQGGREQAEWVVRAIMTTMQTDQAPF